MLNYIFSIEVMLQYFAHLKIKRHAKFFDIIEAHCYFGELILSKYVAESITRIAGCFGREGLCQLRTNLKKLQYETCYIANTGQWCCVMKSGYVNDQ